MAKVHGICPDIKFQLISFENTPENAREILGNLGQNIDVVAGLFDESYFNIKHCTGFEICKVPITPYVCRHTYCSNMAKSGMNPKTLQYLMGHSDIGVTLNTYTHLGLEDAADGLKRMEDLEIARKELEKAKDEKTVS